MTPVHFTSAALLGYVAGSLPFAFVTARLRGVDLRHAGSRNLGAANVLRTAGTVPALVVLAGDAAKGAVAVLLANSLFMDVAAAAIAGIAAVVGHVFPVWLGFRGGKGVATAAGVFAVLAPFATVVAVMGFIVTVLLTRFVSAGSIVAALALPFVAAAIASPTPVIVAAACSAALVISRHRGNLGRLANGTERRIGMRA
jgi:glycerol-3-phosphate acyltransferase PlsY